MDDQLIAARLAVLLFTDIVSSTDFKSKFGINEYAPRLRRHNELFETIRLEYEGSQILKSTGDGYFAEFRTPSDAVSFAMRFQQALHDQTWSQFPLQSRIGIHVGQVVSLVVNGQPDVVGLAADLTSRVMGLACGGQILLTRTAFEDAKQFSGGDALTQWLPGAKLGWKSWSKYLIKGSDEPIEIYEMGIEGIAPLTKPEGSDKAKPLAGPGMANLLHWKPEPDTPIPSKPHWVLQKKIGQGGFGEVWLAKHESSPYSHVFKFCSDTTKLQSLEQEMHLFEHLRQKLGFRRDIAQLIDVNLKELPFFLESEFAEGGDLAVWAQTQGGIDKIPLPRRIEIIAQIADALAAAHSVGVLHKDVKPGNILIDLQFDASAAGQRVDGFQPRLADFGIGALVADDTIDQSTGQQYTGSAQSRYAAPEILMGKEFTTQSDIYALGVLLFQVVSGNLLRSLGHNWQQYIQDPLLQEDIAACVESEPAKRLGSAAELATRLRTLDERRALQQADSLRQHELARAKRQVRRTRVRAAVALAAIILIFLGVYVRHVKIETQRDMARNQAIAGFLGDMLRSADPFKARSNHYNETLLYVLDTAKSRLGGGTDPSADTLADQKSVRAVVCDCMGQAYRHFCRINDAKWAYEQAVLADQSEPELNVSRRVLLQSRYASALLDCTGDKNQQDKLQKVLADLQTMDAKLAPSDPARGYWRYQKARAQRAASNTGDAISLLTDALSIGATADFAGDEQRRRQFKLMCQCELALVLQSDPSRATEARVHFDAIETSLNQDNLPDSLVKARCNRALAQMHLKNNEPLPAIKYATEALRLTQQALGDQCLDTIWAHFDLANALRAAGQYNDECTHRELIYKWACQTGAPMRAMFAGQFGLCLVALNQPSKAAPALDDCIHLFQASDSRSPQDDELAEQAADARKKIGAVSLAAGESSDR